MARTLCKGQTIHSGRARRQLFRAALLVALIPNIASKPSSTFNPRGLFGLQLRPSTGGQLTSAFFGSDVDEESSFGRQVNASVDDSFDGEFEADDDDETNVTCLDAVTPRIQLVSPMPRIERKLSFTRDFFSAKRPFSIEDLGSLLSDPMGLFQKRKDKLARAGTDVTVHLGNHSKNKTVAAPDVEQRPLLTIAEREALVRKWGFAFELAEAEAVSIFERLRTSSSGLLSKKEFMAALRLLGVEKPKRKRATTFFRGKHSYNRLLEFMFNAIDLDNVGAVSCYAFLDWLLTMTSGNPESRLRWGFNVCDTDGDGYADKVEITALLTSMFSVLTGLRLDHQNPYVDIFVSSLFQHRTEAGAKPDLLSWEDYKRGCLGSADVMALVHSPDQPYRKGYFGGTQRPAAHTKNKKVLKSGGLALRLGKAMVMGQKKCDFILAMMLGLQVAVEPPVARASTPPLEVDKPEEHTGNILDAVRGFLAGLLAGRDHDHDQPDQPAPPTPQKEPEPATSAVGVDVVGEEEKVEGEREEGEGETKAEVPYMEAEKKWWQPWKSTRHRLRPEITVQTYRLPSVLRWSEQEEPSVRGCLPSLASFSSCIPAASPHDTPSAITAYGATLYRQIRTVFGVSDDTFLASLGIKQVIGGLLMGDMRGMAEQVSEGRSGSLFYYSHDGNFMVKTVSTAESKTMLNMLPDYCEYIRNNPDTLLMRILGQFDLLHCGKKYHLVVLANVFNTSLPIHERFDLKGSTFGRTLGPKRGIPGLVHRDVDFTETGRQIRVSPELAERLTRQICADAAFLEKQNVLDYSLLVGVHRRKKASDASVEGPLYPRESVSDQYGVMDGPEPQHQTWAAQNSKSLQVLFDTLRAGLEDQQKRGAVATEVMDKLVFSKFAEFAHKCSSKGGSGAATDAPAPAKPEHVPQKGSKSSASVGGSSYGAGTNIFQQTMGGMYGSSRAEAEGREEEVLFVGIIDTLVPFKMKKKAEYWIKNNVLQRGKNFSVIPPSDYATRFVKFCTSIVHSFPT